MNVPLPRLDLDVRIERLVDLVDDLRIVFDEVLEKADDAYLDAEERTDAIRRICEKALEESGLRLRGDEVAKREVSVGKTYGEQLGLLRSAITELLSTIWREFAKDARHFWDGLRRERSSRTDRS